MKRIYQKFLAILLVAVQVFTMIPSSLAETVVSAGTESLESQGVILELPEEEEPKGLTSVSDRKSVV